MKRNKLGIWGLGVFLFLVCLPVNSLDSWIQGPLPDMRQLVARVYAQYILQCNYQEAKSALEALGPENKSALIDFIGESGKKYILGQCRGEVCSLVRNFKPERQLSEDEFAKLYAEILFISSNRLPMDRYNRFIAATAEEIGAQGVFLGWRGLNRYFSGLEFSRHEVVLQNTPTWLFLETGLRRYAEIKDYTCIMYKQERLGRELQGVETILLKYREKPKSIYMKWLEGPWKGRELLYNETLSKTDVRVREKGVLGVIPVWINYNNPIAQRGTNHPAIEIGLKYILDLNTRDYKRASARKELDRKDHGIQEVDGRKVYVMENILPRDKKKGYYCYRVFQYMDYLNGLEPKVEIYNWDDKLQESFTYTKLKLNVGLTDQDFDPKNPEYRL